MKTNALIMGRVGTGKTHSLRTIVDAGIDLRVISMEPSIEDILGDIPCPQLHWKCILPLRGNWSEITAFISKGSTMSMKTLAEISDPNRSNYKGFLNVFNSCQNFVCDRCGTELGCVDDWDATTALAMDGLTGLCKLTMQYFVGIKPFVSLPEYGMAQKAVMALIDMWLPAPCSNILIAHTDREFNEATGQTSITVNAIGQKLAPQIVKAFSEVVSARREYTREGMRFYWDTTEAGEETKVRRLPWGDRLAPSFEPLLQE